MLEVSFYVLSPVLDKERQDNSGTSHIHVGRPENVPDNSGTSSIHGGRLLFACKLAEKAYRQGVYCIIYTSSEVHSRVIDDLLWTFRNTSFLPHQVLTQDSPANNRQILICTNFLPAKENLTVINLTQHCPKDFDRCERILEILEDEESAKLAGRQRYRQYQQIGARLVTHKL